MSDLLLYNHVREKLLRGTLPLTQPYRVVLLAATYTPSAEHTTWADAQAHQIIGTGYGFGGKPLPTPVSLVTYDNQSWMTIGGLISWPGSSFLAKYAVIVRSAVPDILPSDPLLGYSDLKPEGGALVVQSGILEITFADNTILTLR